MKWTEETKAQLRTLWLEGSTAKQIGETLGFSRNAVMGQINRMGLMGQGKNKPAHQAKLEPVKHTIPSLTQRQCHWPLGPTMEPSQFFCGEPVEYAGRPYCACHAQLAYSGWQPRYLIAEKTQNGKLGAEEFAKRRLAFQRRGRSAPIVPSLVPGQTARTG